ncbi:ankyrin repeat domain-containing protein [Sphingomonas sp. PsM26]|nr:ankyrin repeat domain-containing protein [Sphingomonas sp. PsM26]
MAERVRRLAIVALSLLACGSAAAQDEPDAALARAIRANDVAAARAALARHADPNRRLAFQATPLGWAVDTQNPEMVAALIAGGARLNTADIDGVSPLGLACELGEPAIVTALLRAGADARTTRPDGVTPLAICARYGPADAVAWLLAHGAVADAVDSRGQTPLMWAAAGARSAAIALLLKAGADVNRVSKGGFPPLFFAIKGGGAAATEQLLAAGARADDRGPERSSALQLATYQKNYAAAVVLVARGGDVTERDREGYQTLHRAAAAGDTALIAALLARRADPNATTGLSRITWVTEANFGVPPPPVPPTPPLLIAAANGQAEAMAVLRTGGADPSFVAADGTNVVLAAARGRNAATLALALSLAPDANVADAQGNTALHLLLGGGMQPDLPAMIGLLADHGARIDIANKRGSTVAEVADTGLSDVKAVFRARFPDRPNRVVAQANPRPAPRIADPR